jgi:hypothetical protein
MTAIGGIRENESGTAGKSLGPIIALKKAQSVYTALELSQKTMNPFMEDLMTPSQRKAKTLALLRKNGIPYFQGLPCIESENETELRTPDEVGIRMLCLFCVIGTAYDPSDLSYKQYLKKSELWDYLSPAEVSFLSSPAPDKQSAINFTWRSEALFLLMWTVGLFETLPFPARQTDNEEIIARFPSFQKAPWPFIRSLQLRPKSDILDASDLVYRLHWATRQAELEGHPPPAGLIPGVVHEWHYAINWITKYENLEWDDVTTST